MLILNLKDFLIDVYKIDYKYYEYGYCHAHDHSNIDNEVNFRIIKMFPEIDIEIIENVVREFKIKHYEQEYNIAFYNELKSQLALKVKNDIKNLCGYLNEKYVTPILSFEANNIVIPNGNIIKKAILAVYNKKYDENYDWNTFEQEKFEQIKCLQPPKVKEDLKYTRKDVILLGLHLLNEFDKYFNTGYGFFKFDISQIKVTATYNYKEEDVISHIKRYYPEAYKNSNPSLFLILKRREVERILEKEQKQLKKKLAKERRKYLKALAKRGGTV